MAYLYTTAADQVAPYTNISDTLDLMAPAHNATTAYPGSTYISSFGGTSAAGPFVLGLAFFVLCGLGIRITQAAKGSIWNTR